MSAAVTTRKAALAMVADGWVIVSFPETRYMKAGYSLIREGQAIVELATAVGNWLVDTGVFTRDVEQGHRVTGPITYTKRPAGVPQ